LVIAGLFLFLPWTTALAIALVLGLLTAVIAYQAAQTIHQPVTTGKEAMIAGIGHAVSDLNPAGLVRVGGELWVAEATEPIGQGSRVQVLEVSGAKMKVGPWSS